MRSMDGVWACAEPCGPCGPRRGGGTNGGGRGGQRDSRRASANVSQPDTRERTHKNPARKGDTCPQGTLPPLVHRRVRRGTDQGRLVACGREAGRGPEGMGRARQRPGGDAVGRRGSSSGSSRVHLRRSEGGVRKTSGTIPASSHYRVGWSPTLPTCPGCLGTGAGTRTSP
jgi:hypothetical protein